MMLTTEHRGLASVLIALQRLIRQEGSLRCAARRLGVSAAYLSDVMHEKRWPGPSILHPLGFDVRVARIYRKQSARAY